MKNDLLNSLLANNLADFEGLHIEGVVPIKPALINALIADFLHEDDVPSTPDAPLLPSPPAPDVADVPAVVLAPAAKSSSKGPSLQKIIKPLIKRAEVKAVEGKILIEFEIQR